jgi:hypothetical protein
LTDPANIKRRFKVMIVGDTIAMLAAAVLAYGYFARGVQWMLPAFVAAAGRRLRGPDLVHRRPRPRG